MRYNNFQEMEVWKISIDLVKSIYKLTNNPSYKSDFSLKDQIRRSAVSIPSNIAEGFDRSSNKEFLKFLHYAKGSCSELITQIIISKEIEYINDYDFKETYDLLNKISKSLGGLMKALNKINYY